MTWPVNMQWTRSRKKLELGLFKDEYEAIVTGKDDEELIAWAREHQAGLHMATPVFDGAEEGADPATAC